MARGKHTPGPWKAEGDDEYGFVIRTCYNEDQIAVTLAGQPRQLGEEEHNARLIAAAPDMASALEFIASADTGQYEVGHNRAFRLMIETARESLVKARGEK